MRPVKLEMTAFGPYLEKQTVDFEKIKDSLFLITGDTGAGKTTIFDAMSFALYGVSSGNDRKPLMFRCDKADDKTKTEVSFYFEHNGHRYHIERSLKVTKHRDGTTDAEIDKCSMTGDDIAAIERARDIEAKVTEIIGLNAEQFRQIIVLPQGEFRKFLKSGSDDKNRILGRLFDSRLYVGFQNRLEEASKIIGREKDKISESIQNTLKSLKLPEDMDEAERLKFNLDADNSNIDELILSLSELVEKDRGSLGKVNEELKKLDEKLTEKRNAETIAETANRDLDSLKAAKEKKAELDARKREIEIRELNYTLAEKALHGVYPHEKNKADALKDLESTERLRNDLKAKLSAAKADRKAAEKNAEENPELEKKINENSVRIGEIDKVLPIFADIDEGTRQLEKKSAQLKALEGREKELQEKLSADRAEMEKLADELKEYDGVEEKLSAAADKRNELLKKYKDIEKLGSDLKKQIAEAKSDIADAENKRREKLNEKAAAAVEYNSSLSAFMDAQAGIIADEIRADIEKNGEASCRVCGRKLLRVNIPELAVKPVNTPTEEQVDLAKQRSEEADNALTGAESDLKIKKQKLESIKENLMVRASTLFNEELTWENLSAEGYLSGKLEEVTAGGLKVKAELNELEGKKALRDKKTKREAELRKSVPETEKKLNETSASISSLNSEIAGLNGKLTESRKRISDYGDEFAAIKRKNSLTTENSGFAARLEGFRKALERAQKNYNGLAGQLKAAEENLVSAEEKAEKAELEYRDRLTRNGFGTELAYRTALMPVGSADGEAWLKEENAAINGYYTAVDRNAVLVKDLEKRTENKEYTDLTALGAEIEGLAKSKDELSGERDNINAGLRAHESARDSVKRESAELKRYSAAYRRVSGLANAANGKLSKTAKLKFDAYVMGEVFEEVLDQANMRLDTLQGGKYVLVHREDAANNSSQSGLDINVLDRDSGKERDSATLSGGEGFLASLALALGLSDVVQSRSGGSSIDAVFIDEGFGTLDDEKLDNSVAVLRSLTEGDRMVGIISHVDKLSESIDSRIDVISPKNGKGSRIIQN